MRAIGGFCCLTALLVVMVYVDALQAQERGKCATSWGSISAPDGVGDIDAARRTTASRPVLHTSRISPGGGFRVHYDTSGANVPALLNQGGLPIPGSEDAYVDSVAGAFDKSWTFIVDGLGYDPPPRDTAGGDDRYDVYIMQLPTGVFGETQFESEPLQVLPNARYVSWILIDNDFSHVL